MFWPHPHSASLPPSFPFLSLSLLNSSHKAKQRRIRARFGHIFYCREGGGGGERGESGGRTGRSALRCCRTAPAAVLNSARTPAFPGPVQSLPASHDLNQILFFSFFFFLVFWLFLKQKKKFFSPLLFVVFHWPLYNKQLHASTTTTLPPLPSLPTTTTITTPLVLSERKLWQLQVLSLNPQKT